MWMQNLLKRIMKKVFIKFGGVVVEINKDID